jgi:hypothetical protein
MFENMKIEVVGKEHDDNDSQDANIEDDEESEDEDDFDWNENVVEDNKIS